MLIFFSEEFLLYLEKLFDTLSLKYFSFESEADNYLERIYDAIYSEISILGTNLPKAGKKYQTAQYGWPTHFIRCRVNSRTTWYILVRINNNRALVTYIHNNNEKIHSITKAK